MKPAENFVKIEISPAQSAGKEFGEALAGASGW
jgi:hypothetical protein